jgi:hypothetical protein
MWLITKLQLPKVILTTLCCWAFSVHAQSEKTWAISGYGQISQTGLSTTIGAEFQTGKLRLFLGPKLVVSKANSISGPWGLVSSISFFPNGTANKFSGFAFADYQNAFQQSACSNGACEQKTNTINEFHGGYGFAWNLNENFTLTSAIGIGFYAEKTFNHFTDENQRFYGYNNLVKLGIRYQFNPKDE